ncbi:MAG TPA: ATP-binding protein [Bryobacteraceae bacterium]|nr:ATP-binding protein [Bryobacteraceae bacterium]
MPVHRHSLRLRLTLWYSAVLLAGLALFGLTTWFVFQARLMAGVDQRLEQTLQGLQTVFTIEGADQSADLGEELEEYVREVPDGGLIQLTDSSGRQILPAGKPEDFPASLLSAPGFQTIGRNRVKYRALARQFEYGGERYSALAAAPLTEVSEARRELSELLIALTPAVLLVAFAGGYWISRRALAPVDEMTRAAESMGVQNLSRRLPVPPTRDELERLALAWNELLERLEKSVERIQQFTADASHELRTPVALIRSTAELALRRERGLEDYRKALREIEIEAERITELTESLLALARADANRGSMPLAPVDVNELVKEAVAQSRVFAEAKGLSFEDAPASRPAMAHANEAGIRRILRILIDNAIEHTPAGGVIAVSATAHNGAVALSVKDSGEGIPPAALPHIFERFYRADEARGRKGAGLGLSLAQAIAQAHGSEIAVQSAPGEGACFRIDLQAARS